VITSKTQEKRKRDYGGKGTGGKLERGKTKNQPEILGKGQRAPGKMGANPARVRWCGNGDRGN